jgi:hypothetical protein
MVVKAIATMTRSNLFNSFSMDVSSPSGRLSDAAGRKYSIGLGARLDQIVEWIFEV